MEEKDWCSGIDDWTKSRSMRLIKKTISKSRMENWMQLRFSETRIKSGFCSAKEWKLYSN